MPHPDPHADAFEPVDVVAGRRPLSRRGFLELVAAVGLGAATVAAAGCTPDQARRIWWRRGGGPLPAGYTPTYPDGVVAGDPRPHASVAWTRLGAPASGEAVTVLWEVSERPDFDRIVAGGVARAEAHADHTVKVAVAGLRPDRWYWYRFTAGTVAGPVGRLRTAPAPWSDPEHLRFAFGSCQQQTESLYVAHQAIAEEPDLDFFMHLGDYVYVSDGGTLTLADYRSVYHRFKADPLLQRLQATVPLVAMWDDGEFYNGVDRLGPPERLAAAKRAWFETMPVVPPTAEPDRAYRDFTWGTLADLFVLDVRAYRDPAIEAIDTTTPEGAEALAPGRTTLGAAQRAWLLDGLGASRARWRFLGNPYNMGPWRLVDLDTPWPRPAGVVPNAGIYAPNEAWDDYVAERREILTVLADRGIANTVSCSAHTHFFIATELQPDYDDPTSPTVAHDFTAASLTADPDLVRAALPTPPDVTIARYRTLSATSLAINPFQHYLDFLSQGYALVDVTPSRTVVEFKRIDTYNPVAEPEVVARFTLDATGGPMQVERFDT